VHFLGITWTHCVQWTDEMPFFVSILNQSIKNWLPTRSCPTNSQPRISSWESSYQRWFGNNSDLLTKTPRSKCFTTRIFAWLRIEFYVWVSTKTKGISSSCRMPTHKWTPWRQWTDWWVSAKDGLTGVCLPSKKCRRKWRSTKVKKIRSLTSFFKFRYST